MSIDLNPNSAKDKYGIDLRLVINGLQKPLITSRTSGLTLIISTIRFFKAYTAELHLTKSQQVDYQIFGNILICEYLIINTTNS